MIKELSVVVAVICSSTIICTILSNFITDGSTKKIISLVLGAFILCSLILPVKNAVNCFDISTSKYEEENALAATDDEAYSKEIVKQTKENLEQTLSDFLLQNGVTVNKCKFILSLTEENSIIISSVSIYINKEYVQYTDLISEITMQNFTVVPSIITE